ncbi:uncharacterized protein LOC126980056 [Leptidea sinapis]|uniref:uncharacterized protein LOC126980056 n=1 Tax=Leptidea sinapis TaxID=189913 RepID=UPI00212DB315|nr:uncharacterized protein LOC126980056 [Leptidea sinapis]
MYRLVILTFVSSALAYLDGDIDLTDGIKLVGVPVSNSIEDEGRSLGASPFYKIARFLQGHELHVKLPSLIEKEKLSQVFAESLKAVDETYKEKAATGRGKGDGGTGSLALLGLMFAKTIGAAGIGGLGLLTMKALAVSALALMLSAIVGIKKLTSHDDHDDHQVIYAGHGHHRRKRDLHTPLPYQGWTEYRL